MESALNIYSEIIRNGNKKREFYLIVVILVERSEMKISVFLQLLRKKGMGFNFLHLNFRV